jgi:hypothetical protein
VVSWNYTSSDDFLRLRPKEYYFKRFIIGAFILLVIQLFDDGLFALFIGIPVALYIFGIYLNFHSGMWLAIQDEHVRTNPSKAAWLLLFPLFNLYWYFVVYPGFVVDYNRYLKRYSLEAPGLSSLPFLLLAILSVLGSFQIMLLLAILTGLGVSLGRYTNSVFDSIVICGVIRTVMFFAIIAKVCEAAKALTVAKRLRNTEEMNSPVHVRREVGGIVIDE